MVSKYRAQMLEKRQKRKQELARLESLLSGPYFVHKTFKSIISALDFTGQVDIRGSLRIENGKELVLEIRIAGDKDIDERIEKTEEDIDVLLRAAEIDP